MSTPVIPISPTIHDARLLSAKLTKLEYTRMKVFNYLRPIIGFAVCVLIVADSILNNWSLNNYTGDAYHFRTPVVNVASAMDVRNQYLFPITTEGISPVGLWMSAFNVFQLANIDPDMYLLTAGSYVVNEAMLVKDICPGLVGSYVIPNNTVSIKLAQARDYMTYIQGNLFSQYDITQLPSNVSAAYLTGLGFSPSRLTSDLRLTTSMTIDMTARHGTANLSMYRIYSKSFCTGCTPIAELGLVPCTLNYSFNKSSSILTISSSDGILGSMHEVGVIIQKNGFVITAVVLKVLSLVWVIVSFGASRKTTRWIEVETWFTLPWYSKLWYTVAPPIFRYSSDALSLSSFYYNCDVFVVGYSAAVLMDMNASLVYAREVNIYNDLSPNSLLSLQLYAMGLRFLWVNCLLLKAFKVIFHFFSSAAATGENRLVRFCNLSSVIFVYISGIALLNVNALIEANNASRIDIPMHGQRLDGVHLDVFSSWFFRALPAVFAIGIINLFVVLVFNHLAFYNWWGKLERNTLARQFIYNSTAILVEMFDPQDFSDAEVTAIAPLTIPARSLCTLQWLLTCHLRRFGLTEAPNVVKAIVSQTVARKVTTESNHDLFMIVQDSDGNVRLYDAHKLEVQSLGMEVKILNNTNYLIG
ncbi:hypothetical protein THRCLA_05306 [Thraustotheca clavata]|uniref:Transmembrane protein n=1 Tax=Thraustotheca clavata TaxID=74557 RepID=A0A1V9ZWA6_9STRA|nr:hypothetical protein THRCLA_05306 [Thraustotheca clavata]